MLDYAYEIEHFDRHLGRMLKLLEERGQIENTLVVVTADNGMPFPRVKGQEYELSNHLPLAIMWPGGIKKPGRVIDDYVSFIDFAPTFLEVAGVDWKKSGMQPSPGRSLTDVFNSTKSGQINPQRDHVLIGKERHDIGRPHDWGYPIRGIVKDNVLYIENFETDRWPAGNPETGYLNCDGSPTKTAVLESRKDARFVAGRKPPYKPGPAMSWYECFGKRPREEMFNVADDIGCTKDLARNGDFRDKKAALKNQLYSELKAQGDPRMFGRGYVFEQYPYANAGTRNFYERFMKGEKLRAGWVNRSDFDPQPQSRE
jgi:arylsulfatase A-like enzyme